MRLDEEEVLIRDDSGLLHGGESAYPARQNGWCQKLTRTLSLSLGFFVLVKYQLILLNPFPNKPWFLCVCSTSLLKTLWEKEKLLVTSNFSFSHCFAIHLESFLPFLSNLKLLSANSFSLEESKICCLGKG